MNAFRFAGDMSHLVSVLVLLLKIYATKSCSGYPRARTPPLPRISAGPLWNLNFWAFRCARDLAQDAGAVRPGVPDSLPRSLHLRRLSVQHLDEDRVHRQFSRHCLVHEVSPLGAADVR